METNSIILSNNLYEDWKEKRNNMGDENLSRDSFIEWIADQIYNMY